MSTVSIVERVLGDRPFSPVDIGIGAITAFLWVAMLAGWFPIPLGEAGPMSAPGVLEAHATANGLSGALLYLLLWGGMMAAMMLPAMSQVAYRYGRSVTGSSSERAAALGIMLVTYSLGWAAMGIVPLLFDLIVPITELAGALGPLLVGGLLMIAGVYQFSERKHESLSFCCKCSIGDRQFDPRDAAVFGGEHFVKCLACTWALFALLVGVGTMNVMVMLALTVLITLERLADRGHVIGTTAGTLMIGSGLFVLILGVPI